MLSLDGTEISDKSLTTFIKHTLPAMALLENLQIDVNGTQVSEDNKNLINKIIQKRLMSR